MTFDLEDIIRRANEAYFAQTKVGIPESIRLSLREKYQDKIIDDDLPDCYGMTEDERLDSSVHGQADPINRERDRI